MNIDAFKVQLANALQWAQSGTKLMYSAIGVGLVVGLILFKVFFKDIAGFIHCIGFSVSSQSGSGGAAGAGQSKSSRWKLLFGILLPAGSAYAAYILLPRYLPQMFH
jgi:hypothetical protein